RVRLAYTLLVEIDDQIAYIPEAIACLLLAPGPGKAVAEDSGAIARAQAGEVVGQLDVEFAQILGPEVGHKGVEFRLIEPQDRGDALFYLGFRNGRDAAG